MNKDFEIVDIVIAGAGLAGMYFVYTNILFLLFSVALLYCNVCRVHTILN